MNRARPTAKGDHPSVPALSRPRHEATGRPRVHPPARPRVGGPAGYRPGRARGRLLPVPRAPLPPHRPVPRRAVGGRHRRARQAQSLLLRSTGGGVWRTTDGGRSWENISDGFFGGSIGAVAVSESDPNVIYVGGGEKTVRGNVSHGDGVWKSTDAGKTWKHVGLDDTRHIPRVRIHPKNPDVVYVAALGHLYGPNERARRLPLDRRRGDLEAGALRQQRGRARSTCVLDPNNPRDPLRQHLAREAHAVQPGERRARVGAVEEHRRRRHLEGDHPGHRACRRARSASSASRSRRSTPTASGPSSRPRTAASSAPTNAGQTWTKINDDRNLRQRAWYYTRIYAGPKNIDEVYVVNVGFHRSADGGKTFTVDPHAARRPPRPVDRPAASRRA